MEQIVINREIREANNQTIIDKSDEHDNKSTETLKKKLPVYHGFQVEPML